MIEKVVVRYKKHDSIWSSGVIYDSVLNVPDGEVVFSKRYPRGVSEKKVWEDIRSVVSNWFIEMFYLGVVSVTKPPKHPTGDAMQDLLSQSRHVQKKVLEKPERYFYCRKHSKWHISRKGYVSGLEDAGVSINMGLGSQDFMHVDEDNAISFLKKLQDNFHGETVEIILFVYPDRYDEEIRAMFDLEITFYPSQ